MLHFFMHRNVFLMKRWLLWIMCVVICSSMIFLWYREKIKINSHITQIEKTFSDQELHRENAFLEVYYFELTRGDAIFINYSDQYQILIDGGASPKQVARYLPLVMPKDDREIEMMMITHKHLDHFVGLPEVLQKFDVVRVLHNTDDVHETIMDELDKQNVQPENVWRGDELVLDDLFSLTFIGPDKDMAGQFDSDNNSIAFKMSFGIHDFLFLGDAKKSVEHFWLDLGIDITADFLKVGHHGYDDATGDEFLSHINPRHAIITPGGTPKKTIPTMQKLQKFGIETFEIMEHGSVTVKCMKWNDKCTIK
jgi:competence protein ComEC